MKVDPVNMQPIRPISGAVPGVRPAEDDRKPPGRSPGDRRSQADGRRRAAESALAWLEAAGRVRDAAARLAEASLWSRRSVWSSDPAALAGRVPEGAPLSVHRIEIVKTARAQRNRGFELAGGARSVIEPGRHTFILTCAGKTHAIEVEIEASDTNALALARLAGAINAAEAGVRAVQREVRRFRLVRLELAGAVTGARGAFELTDEDGSAVSATGIGNIAVPAEDAVFRVNGGPDRTSPVNEAALDRGRLRLAWSPSAHGEYDVAVVFDADAIAAEVRSAIGGLNELAGIHRTSGGSLHPALLRELERAVMTEAAERLGIAPSDAGWGLEERLLGEAVRHEPERVRRELAGPEGWAAGIIRAMERFLAMPAEALLSPEMREAGTYAPGASGGAQVQPAAPASGWYFDSTYY